MKVINLTPHKVDICDKNGKIIKTYERSGKIARLGISYEQIEDVDGVPVTVRQISRVVNLPEPEEGVMYIVSNYVLDYCSERTDLLAPESCRLPKFYEQQREELNMLFPLSFIFRGNYSYYNGGGLL